MMGKPIMFLLVICLSLAMAVSTLEAAEPPPRNVAAVTLDFCETPTLAGKRFWSRQDTEQWYKTIHDTGFDTVYLRMSNGRAYWPSKVLLMYTNHGHGHHGEVLEKVVQDRDLLKEFVEVGRKYGKKLVYWLPIYDDETTTNNYVNNPEMAAKHGLFPWQSVLGRDQPGLYWEHRDAWKYPRERDKAGDIMPNDKRRWWGGCPVYLYEAARKYRLDLCRELVERYDMDGVCYTLRSHSWWHPYMPLNGDRIYEYGFNQIIVDEYSKRYGVNIRTQDFDREKWAKLRGEGLTQLVRETYEYLEGEGKEFHMMINPGPGYGVDEMSYMQEQRQMFWGKLHTDWKTWVANEWMHVGILYGTWVRDRYGSEWQAAVSAVRKEIGSRNIPVYLQYRSMGPKDSAGPFREDIPKMFADKNLDGVVIYEADNIMWGDPNDANNLLKVLNNLFTGR